METSYGPKRPALIFLPRRNARYDSYPEQKKNLEGLSILDPFADTKDALVAGDDYVDVPCPVVIIGLSATRLCVGRKRFISFAAELFSRYIQGCRSESCGTDSGYRWRHDRKIVALTPSGIKAT